MAIFKCKMCGGTLTFKEEKYLAVCDYCGTLQTISSANDEKRIILFNNANRLRLNHEFDKAEVIYENIISEFPEDAEAYWGICLCKFGIEYVDDSVTNKKIPTCHRTQFISIFDDENYKQAILKADVVARNLYFEEAKAIDKLQKDILSVVRAEEPYDVFICYKDTSNDGQRTQDSIIAQDIYDALTEKGMRVFFSRISLEDKLGTMYEPYIFSALNSAKVMLVVGTKYENFVSPWVKNEWSRFLQMMKINKGKTLIPCYCNINPDNLPPEIKNIQGQDMQKIGFMQDLVRGVGKIVNPQKSKKVAIVPVDNKSVVEILNKAKSIESAIYEINTLYDELNSKRKLYSQEIEKNLNSIAKCLPKINNRDKEKKNLEAKKHELTIQRDTISVERSSSLKKHILFPFIMIIAGFLLGAFLVFISSDYYRTAFGTQFQVGCTIAVISGIVFAIVSLNKWSKKSKIIDSKISSIEYEINRITKAISEIDKADKENQIEIGRARRERHRYEERNAILNLYNNYIGEIFKRVNLTLENLEASRTLVYKNNYIHPKYRNIVPIFQFYEYFSCGVCTTLTGAYRSYENNVSSKIITTDIENLRIILSQQGLNSVAARNQYTLSEFLVSVNEGIKKEMAESDIIVQKIAQMVNSQEFSSEMFDCKYNKCFEALNRDFENIYIYSVINKAEDICQETVQFSSE